MAEAPAISVQAVEMPQGGGGIEGLGEQSASDEFTGRYTLSVPLRCSPCRGFEPQLELTYSSFAGNGTFGRGFDVAVSSLGRWTAQRIPRYDDGDVFVLDGEPLTPLAGGVSERTVAGVAYEVTAFRPRAESSFDRVERWTSGPFDAFWRVLNRDGSVLVYGRTPAARIVDPGDPDRTAEWLLEEAFGPHGDLRHYLYKQEDAAGVGSSQCERGRVQVANRYLERIRYGNEIAYLSPDGGVTPAPDGEWHFEVVFDYGEYDVSPSRDDPYAPVGEWKGRPDPFSEYRCGFERRTHRLCRNVLMFHRFGELGPLPVLVNALALEYDEDPAGTSLASCRLIGYRNYPKQPRGQRYVTRATPTLELGYAEFDPAANTAAQPLFDSAGGAIEGFAASLSYAVADLDGVGVPGLLYADGESVSYRAPVLTGDGHLSWTPPRSLAGFPAVPGVTGPGIELADLNGDGILDLVQAEGGLDGFYRSRGAAEWDPFVPFEGGFADYRDPIYARADLIGDGHADVLWKSPDALGYFPSRGEEGFGAAEVLPAEPTLPPALARDDPTQLVTFADLLGGGVACLVRVRDGSVECWPSLGYGRFAPAVQLDGAPSFAGEFDSSRVYLGDVDGSGAAAIAFAYADRVEVFRNLGGNGFAAEPIVVPLPAPYARPEQIRFADLRGAGYDCIVFSSEDPTPQLWCIDLCGGAKPYLLGGFDNGMGKRRRVSYGSAAHERLRDEAEGLRWVTRLPFPLQVVTEIATADLVSGAETTASYRYHHGYYDHVERQTRGFGMVESKEEEAIEERQAGEELPQAAPLLTRTWYLTGAWEPDAALERAYRGEYYGGDAKAWPPIPTELPVAARDAEQGSIALAGDLVRRERYGLDGSGVQATPYDVVERGYLVRTLQPASPDGYGAYLVEEQAEVEARYERDREDPLVRQHFVLGVDEFGAVLLECTVACSRRPGAPDPAGGQLTPRAIVTQSSFYDLDAEPDAWLLGIPAEQLVAEVLDLPPPDVGGLYYSREAIAARVQAALAGGEVTVFGLQRCVYVGDPVTPQALLERREEAVFSDTVATATFAEQPLPEPLKTLLAGRCGYRLDPDEYWWNPSTSESYAGLDGFFRPLSTRDALATGSGTPAGTVVEYAYDAHSLLLTSTTMSSSGKEVLPSVVAATGLDYVALAACQIRDENGTVHEAQRDPLGVVALLSFHGSEWSEGGERAVGFAPLDFDKPPPTPDGLDELLADPAGFLGEAFRYSYHDLGAWRAGRGPCSAATLESPAYPGTAADPTQVSLSFRDGSLRLVQRTDLVEPGPAGGSGAWADPRWRTSASTRYNGRGLPVREYRPAFAATYRYADPAGDAAAAFTTAHDPLGREIRVDTAEGDFPCAFFSTLEYTAWSTVRADRNDTVEESAYYRYYVDEGHPGLGRWDRDALAKAATAAGTPETEELDSLGFLSARRLLLSETGPPLVETHAADAMGNELWSADPRLGPVGVRNFERAYSLENDALRIVSVDAGTCWLLRNAVGKLIFRSDSRGFAVLTEFDGLHRPVTVTVSGGDGPVQLANAVEYRVYGDSLDASGEPPVADPASRNLIGREWHRYDSSGLYEQSSFSLAGGPTATAFWLRAAYEEEADWKLPATAGTWAQRTAALATALDGEAQATAATYDALGRAVTATDAAGNLSAVSFHLSGLPDSLDWTPAGGTVRAYVVGTEYDANAQPLAVTFGDPEGAPVIEAGFVYDPATWRLRRELTTRLADKATLQDLTYHYDPVGNLTHVENAAPLGPATPPADRDHTFDALYRLVGATGRAQAGYSESDERAPGYAPFFVKPGVPEAEAYALAYDYDEGSNLRRVAYAGSSQWSTEIEVAPGSNRGVRKPASPDGAFDANGNALALDGVDSLTWTYANRVASLTAQGATQWMLYDSLGRRAAKVVVSGETVERTLYLGSLERCRRTVGGTVEAEFDRVSLGLGEHVRGVALDWRTGSPPAGASTAWFQLTDLLGSAVVEVDDEGQIRHGEEYLPFGGTALAYAPGGEADMSLKARRHGGRERDPIGGLYDYGLRYQACWLGRWISPDPLLDADGLNLYSFAGNNPATMTDAFGLCRTKSKKGSSSRHSRQSKIRLGSSRARHMRRFQRAYGGTRNIAVMKLVKGTGRNREVLYLLARSMGVGVRNLTLGSEERTTSSGTKRKRHHSEAVLAATIELGHVNLEGEDIDLAPYRIAWVASTNQACGKDHENCGGDVIWRFGADVFSFLNEYEGSAQAKGYEQANNAWLGEGYESDEESEDEGRVVRGRKAVVVAVLNDRDLRGVDLADTDLEAVSATSFANALAAAPQRGQKRMRASDYLPERGYKRSRLDDQTAPPRKQ